MTLVVAVIPAKSNSRRLPGKNLRSLGERALFLHSVDVALQSKLIDKVVVSSDAEEILEIASNAGAIALKRPVELCGDQIPNFAVCKHIVETLGRNGDIIEKLVLLQPTQPFRIPADLDDALRIFTQQSDSDSLISVKRNHRLKGTLNGNRWCSSIVHNGVRAQVNDDNYEVTGHLFILRTKATVMCGSLLGERQYAWQLPDTWFDVDIDTSGEFLLAQGVATDFFTSEPPEDQI